MVRHHTDTLAKLVKDLLRVGRLEHRLFYLSMLACSYLVIPLVLSEPALLFRGFLFLLKVEESPPCHALLVPEASKASLQQTDLPGEFFQCGGNDGLVLDRVE